MKDFDPDGRIIVKRLLNREDGRTWTGLMLLILLRRGRFCEAGSEIFFSEVTEDSLNG
jgi:hypothetical protein